MRILAGAALVVVLGGPIAFVAVVVGLLFPPLLVPLGAVALLGVRRLARNR